MSNLRYDGQVAIVTGGGGALGRAYSLLLASRGASVVVNDLGVPMKGSGSDQTAAQKVVDEITKAGGKAVADYHSVLDGAAVVETAIKSFGRVDILINNAGILRDVSFAKMKDSDWQQIHDVHTHGAYKMTKAAWPHMLKQKYGRIVMTTSASGIYGSYGQANYSAAKLALVGFANSLAKEGAKHNVYTNSLAPVAGSRMTATVMPEDLLKALQPSYVAPVVAYLVSKDCTANGNIFEVGGGYVSALRWQRNAGKHFKADSSFTADLIADNWSSITAFDDATNSYPTNLNDSIKEVMAGLSGDAPSAAPAPKKSAPPAAVTPPASAVSSGTGDSGAAALFTQMDEALKKNPAVAKKSAAVYQFNLTNGGKTTTYIIDTKSATPSVTQSNNSTTKSDVALTLSESDFLQLASGKANAQSLFMSGKIKMKGNMSYAMKLGDVLKALQPTSKL